MYIVQRKNKYNAKSSVYDRYYYQSKLEAGYAQFLDLAKHASRDSERVKEWSRQERISLDVNGYHIANYYIDFHVWYADGREALVEVKGLELPVWKMKWKLLEAIYSKEHPDIELIVVK